MTTLPEHATARRQPQPARLLDRLPPGWKSRTAWATSGPGIPMVAWAMEASDGQPAGLRMAALTLGAALLALHAVLHAGTKAVARALATVERNRWTLPALASVPIFRRLASWLPTRPPGSTPTPSVPPTPDPE